jgi:hypothetical protein
VIAPGRPPTDIESLYTERERLGDMLVLSPRVRSQLVRMVSHGLMSDDILEAIEDDAADVLRDLVSEEVEHA